MLIDSGRVRPGVRDLCWRTRSRQAGLALLATTLWIGSLYLAFEPSWETNDDVAMSMVAHGYGLAAYGSPELIFSNVLWGSLVRAIPSIGGVSGYGVATVASLSLACWSMLYFLPRLGVPLVVTWLIGALTLARPMLFPQFTIDAGLVTVAAILAARVHALERDRGSLLAAGALAFLGSLIRVQEFVLVLAVALPLLPWRALRRRRRMQIAVILLGIAVATALAIDILSYSGPKWTAFWDFNAARAPFTDFGATSRLLQRPDIMARYGYSANDVHLIEQWFFADPRIADPKALKAILAELGSVMAGPISVRSGLAAVGTLAAPQLLLLLLPAMVLFAALPRVSVLLSWGLCLAALFVLGLLGRPGILRVYVPLLTLLLLAPLFAGRLDGRARKIVAACALAIGCIVNACTLIPEAMAAGLRIRQTRVDVQALPKEPIAIWGADFPFESAFPPLGKKLAARAPAIYGLGGFQLAPFSVATVEEAAGRGMIARLRSAAGVPVIAAPGRIELLRTYCRERLGGVLRELAIRGTASLPVQQLQCRSAQ